MIQQWSRQHDNFAAANQLHKISSPFSVAFVVFTLNYGYGRFFLAFNNNNKSYIWINYFTIVWIELHTSIDHWLLLILLLSECNTIFGKTVRNICNMISVTISMVKKTPLLAGVPVHTHSIHRSNKIIYLIINIDSNSNFRLALRKLFFFFFFNCTIDFFFS